MRKISIFVSLLFFLTCFAFCGKPDNNIVCGSADILAYLPVINGKNVALVANHTSMVNNRHLVDTLLSLGVNIKKIFTPEHGFRGEAGAGELVASSVDASTGLPLVSLYGNNKKPAPKDMAGVDVVLFDLQDVGVRFYTYLSTMHYVMEACAENQVPMIVLDRPNPNGFYVDGPVLLPGNKSFVGMHPIPLVHGMTLGELALMINGEGWLKDRMVCNLYVVPCLHYSRSQKYILPVKPSPNLPDMKSVYLYPSIGLFEGTVVSEGRGTPVPFQLYGHPSFARYDTAFVPVSIPGMSTNPKLKGQKCFGFSLTSLEAHEMKKFSLQHIINAFGLYSGKEPFFNTFFRLLAGNDVLKQQITSGLSEDEIRQSWQAGLQHFMEIRAKYLLYPD